MVPNTIFFNNVIIIATNNITLLFDCC